MLRPWKLNLAVRRRDGLPVHLQIAQYFIDEICRGRLPPGTPLPGSRALAEELGINRKTAVSAYEELIAQGWLRSEGRQATFVALELPRTSAADSPLQADEMPVPDYPLYGARYESPPLENGCVAFSDGVPDTRLIPFEVLGRAYRRALIATARANRLAYGDPRGEPALRQELAAMLSAERGLRVGLDNICVVRGSQMGIYLVARLLARSGDHVAVDALSYPPAREAFRAAGAQVHGVEMDAFGMRPEALERLCRQHRLRAIYVTPHHQFPTTVLMPAERRMHILALAEQFGFAVVEDDYDHEFHFARRPMFPMASGDRTGRVIYVGSLSKVLAPGLRVGYVVGSREVVDRCANEIQWIDRQGNAVTELAVTDLMQSGELRRHIRRALRVYQERRRLFAEYVSGFKPWADFCLPDGGLALWLQLDPLLDEDLLVRKAREEGVVIASSRSFALDGRAVSGLRLGFGNLTPEAMERGVRGLGRALAATLKPRS
ncbi:PLP-dependent aminotransferase family protein [Zoogloea sp. LCSB751]|uniref:MocR-like pyridoxine biosynthesis transcription factor PdxR n=1 Tax=Zoogloea sp. LCSB751 TaxID=1965277 RepID=UPI0009A49A0B|nr:PLP-dependent aminotransferase family protein [Zoogloea sp. LCSB751]